MSFQQNFSVEKKPSTVYDVDMAKKNQRFLDRLLQLMDSQNPPWSNADLARATGLSESAISNFFKGARTPSADSIAKIALTFGVADDWLLGKSDNALPRNGDPLPESVFESWLLFARELQGV
jgi:transcriptional regulator with XRE-family HTH domain